MKVELYTSQKIRLRVNADLDSWLVVSDLYYPGWSADVDGLETRIWRGNYLLRSLPVQAGSHIVEFTYRPISFRIALWTAAVSLFILLSLPLLRQTGPELDT